MANEQVMGLDRIGLPSVVFKRKYRWTFKVDEVCGEQGKSVEEFYVKVAARPNLTIDETEIHHLNGKMYIPGKGTWETITVTYYDAAVAENLMLWTWISSVYDFKDASKLRQNSKPAGYAGKATLKMWDGCGTLIEQWIMGQIWPKAINFGDLDYSSSDVATVELTLRYATVDYQCFCPTDFQRCECKGC